MRRLGHGSFRRPLAVLASVTVVAVSVALASALVASGRVTTGTYESAILADSPTMYWRLGEADAATTGADSTGHGYTLSYSTDAVLDVEGGLANDPDTSFFADTVASATPASAPSPGAVELWLRTNPPDNTAAVYRFDDSSGTTRALTVGLDGRVHGDVYNDVGILMRMTGPATLVTDGFWHYVVADFVTGYIYVDLVSGGPPIRPATGAAAAAASGGPATIALGAFEGQLDEVAVYPSSLSAARMSAHAAAGGLGWDAEAAAGGEESAPPGCFERGLFWKGAANAAGTANYDNAVGSLNFITTKKQKNRCGTAPRAGSTKKPTFISGQTVRIKLNGTVENYYVEFGPVQYLCDPTTTCWALFFNFKIQSPVAVNDVYWKPFTNNAIPAIAACTPVGTHGYRLVHEGATWAAEFLCDTTTNNWVRFYTYPGGDRGWNKGWPDVEGFNQGLTCGGRTAPARCWRREGAMAETHSNFRWLDTAGSWNSVAFGVCRTDRSPRWDARVSVATPPISIQLFENHRNTGC